MSGWKGFVMEITNEERREVAGRIRERICRNHRTAWDVVLELSYIDVFGDRFRMNKEFTLFLADLIDRPTCHDVTDLDRESFKCSRCGYRVLSIDGAPDAAKLVSPKGGVVDFGYCPNCGAEVVE